MAEFSSLNGYAVKDTTARNIAKGRNQSVAFVDYATMIEALNELEKSEYKAGQNIYIGVVGVPDLWVYGVEDIRHTFTYVSDEDFVEMLNNNTTVQVGFFKLAMLEGQKVDLTTYDLKLAEHTDDIAELNENVETLTDCVGKINVYVGDDKKIHFVDSEGADAVLPFLGLDRQLGVGACVSWTTNSNTYRTATLPAGTYLCGAIIGPNNGSVGGSASASITVNGASVCSCNANAEGEGTGSGYVGYRHTYKTYKLTADATVSANVSVNLGTGCAFCFRVSD